MSPTRACSGLTTIGGGQILGLSNTRLRRKKPWTLDLLAARREAVHDPLRWCEQMVRESESPATVASLQKKCWSRPEEIAAALEQLRAENRVVPAPGGGWLHRAVVQKTGGEHPRRRPDFSRGQPATRRPQPRRTAGGAQMPIPFFWRRRRNRCWTPNNSNATALCWRGPVGTRGFQTATSACATRSPPNCSKPAARLRVWTNWPPPANEPLPRVARHGAAAGGTRRGGAAG